MESSFIVAIQRTCAQQVSLCKERSMKPGSLTLESYEDLWKTRTYTCSMLISTLVFWIVAIISGK
jgi:hypothetical protein